MSPDGTISKDLLKKKKKKKKEVDQLEIIFTNQVQFNRRHERMHGIFV